jgi:2-dehydro-3-deoxyphosphogluconate aldolase / (4S)-4-hydroxy-2-oxoglutarate aldolase
VTTAQLQSAFDSYFRSAPVMVILRGLGAQRTVELCQRAWHLRIPLVEIPVQSDADLDALAMAVAEARVTGRLVGAGTITTVELVNQVADAGAAFTVAPGLDDQIATASARRGLPHLPGVATATEVHRALQLGLRWQKMFPAAQLGSGWITALRAPFPAARFVATGGISTGNAGEFLHAGAAAVSLGSSFADSADDAIRELASRWC